MMVIRKQFQYTQFGRLNQARGAFSLAKEGADALQCKGTPAFPGGRYVCNNFAAKAVSTLNSTHFDDSLRPESWQMRLTSAALGRGDIHYEHTLDSTNVQLRRMALSGAPHGSICLCECQTAGRGRLGRSWHSPEGQGLWVSVLARPKLTPEQAPLVTLVTAMAMQQAVIDLTGTDVAIKWPNDLVLHGKKICGILLEVSADMEGLHHIIIGTGLNVLRGAYPPELAHQATCLAENCTPPARGELLARYLQHLETLLGQLERGGFEAVRHAYEQNCCTIGQRVRVTGGMELTGTAEGIDADGALLVREDDGKLTRVLAGDVSVRGVMGYV